MVIVSWVNRMAGTMALRLRVFEAKFIQNRQTFKGRPEQSAHKSGLMEGTDEMGRSPQ